jgi:hypothetical protein
MPTEPILHQFVKGEPQQLNWQQGTPTQNHGLILHQCCR